MPDIKPILAYVGRVFKPTITQEHQNALTQIELQNDTISELSYMIEYLSIIYLEVEEELAVYEDMQERLNGSLSNAPLLADLLERLQTEDFDEY